MADRVNEMRHDMELTWTETLAEILTAAVYGWSALEKVYKFRRGPEAKSTHFRSRHRDGLIGWQTLAPRSQDSLERWEFDETGRVIGLHQRAAPDYRSRYLPREKFLHFRFRGTKMNPEGRSLLRGAYRAWYIKKRLEELESLGTERNLAGVPVMQVPPEIMSTTANAAQRTLRAHFEEMMSKVRRDAYEGLVIPAESTPDGKSTGYKFSLVTGSSRPIDVNEIVMRWDQRILISVLAELLLVGADQHGSFSLAESKTSLLAMSIGAILASIRDVFNKDAIPELCRLNGFPEELTPTLEHSDLEKLDLAALIGFVSTAVNAGVIIPDNSLEDHLRRAADLPVKDAEATTVLDQEDEPEPDDPLAGLLPQAA